MADEAILRVVLEGQTGQPQPPGGGPGSAPPPVTPGQPQPPSPPPSPPSVPAAGATSNIFADWQRVYVMGPFPLPVTIEGGMPRPPGQPSQPTNDLMRIANAFSSAMGTLSSFVSNVLTGDVVTGIQATGSAVRSFGQQVATINPLLGAMAIASGSLVGAFGDMLKSIDSIVQRYAPFSPDIGFAQTQATFAQMVNDFRRAQQLSPGLVNYIQARSDLQQQYEDVKARFLERILPLATQVVGFAEAALPLVEGLSGPVLNIAEIVGWILEKLGGIDEKIDDPANKLVVPTELFRRDFQPQSPFTSG